MIWKLHPVSLRTCNVASIFCNLTTRAIGSTAQKAVTVDIKKDVAVIQINSASSTENSLNEAVSKGLLEALEQVQENQSIRCAVLISGKPNSFLAGADISMLSHLNNSAEAEELSAEAKRKFERIEKSNKPIVAAIMGTCMGGGLELALACHYRIAMDVPKTKISLPEVMLGLLPGAGGTQRLPKYVSITKALEMMLTGKVLKPNEARRIGLIDRVLQPVGSGIKNYDESNLDYLEKVSVEAAKEISAGILKVNRIRPPMERFTNYFLTRAPLLENVVIKMARDKIMKETHGNYPAPLKILDVVKVGLSSGIEAGYVNESKAFGELTQTSQSAALIGLFNGSTECKKPKFGASKQTVRLAVVGAGFMGAGIANVSIDKGIKTSLLDVNEDGLNSGQNHIHKYFTGLYKRKKITCVQRDNILSNIKPTTFYQDLTNSDVAIEAVFEDLKLKQKIVQQLESVVSDECVIASNTSALPITEISSAARKPERIIGMHYFSPVEKMQLLEIVVTDKTSKETLAKAANLGLTQKKLVVVVKDGPGFFAVRCLSPMISEVIRLLQEGVPPIVLDKLTRAYGFPVGAATLADEVGLDVAVHVSESLEKALGSRIGGFSGSLLTDMLSSGFKGRKSGKGFYIYDAGKKFGIFKQEKIINDATTKILARHQISAPSSVSGNEDRQLRVVSRFVNEAVLCLEEGIISSPSDGDVASVFGLGFPPFWGGPFRFIDIYGAENLIRNMNRFAEAYSPVQFEPSQLLKDMAKKGKKFYNN